MNTIRVALLQIAPTGSLQENLAKGLEYCREAKAQGADIALFPEVWSHGYRLDDLDSAVDADGPFVRAFGACAAEYEMAIGITYLERYKSAVRNTLSLFDRTGAEVLRYAKVHTCDFDAEEQLTAGDEFFVTALFTAAGVVQVGAMICYDREFPESARILMLKGAEIILVPNACPMEINRLSQLRGRAYENMVGIATANYPDEVDDCNGGSSAFDGVAYLPDLSDSRDMCIALGSGEEGIVMAHFDLDMMRRYRKDEVHGNAFRRPSRYAQLVDSEVSEPFIRTRRRG
jgi:predicted amidohydrolase